MWAHRGTSSVRFRRKKEFLQDEEDNVLVLIHEILHRCHRKLDFSSDLLLLLTLNPESTKRVLIRCLTAVWKKCSSDRSP